jgi:hypothetical protein
VPPDLSASLLQAPAATPAVTSAGDTPPPIAPPPRAVQLARNALTGAGRYGASALLALLITPYVLHVLGRERYGIWALAGAVLPVARLLDMGLYRAVTREVADADGQGRAFNADGAVGTGRWLLLGLGTLVLAALFGVSERLVADGLRVPPLLQAEARYVIVGTAVGVCFTVLWALGLDRTLDGVADRDADLHGKALEAARRPSRAGKPRKAGDDYDF